MGTKLAIAILTNISTPELTDEEIGTAILEVLKMPTHMSISKRVLIKVIEWLFFKLFDVPEDEAENVRRVRHPERWEMI